ncbi:MAG: hypothetical protein ACXADL_00215 [Candidatus Thorarchaeota archaeon]
MDPDRISRRLLRFIYEHIVLIIILAIGFGVWFTVFNAAVDDYLASSVWRTRGVWTGHGQVDLFGYTVEYNLEGYTDYSFYYFHWGHNILNGVMPYTPEFGYLDYMGVVNENGAYMFPPFSAYLYGLGIMIQPDGWGIGWLIAAFGYITAFPVYGIAKRLSNNRHVGEAAAFTYLLNPNVLYHIDFVWLNPSPFIFFFFAGFYMLVSNRTTSGTLLIVTAALFKQTAWFLGLPLIAFLLTRAIKNKSTENNGEAEDEGNETTKKAPVEYVDNNGVTTQPIDGRRFAEHALMAITYLAAVLFPFIIAQPNLFSYLSLAAGGFPLESFTELPGYSSPMRLQVLPVVAGMPWLAEILDFLVFYGFLMVMGIVVSFGLMLLLKKREGRMNLYFRQLLLLVMFMMLWIHLMGPRGVFKYYFTLMAPFFSIFASAKMVQSQEETVPFSFSMLWLPIFLSLIIVVPSRNVYLFGVILIFIGYALASYIGRFWNIASAPTRYAKSRIMSRLNRVVLQYSNAKTRFESIIYSENTHA